MFDITAAMRDALVIVQMITGDPTPIATMPSVAFVPECHMELAYFGQQEPQPDGTVFACRDDVNILGLYDQNTDSLMLNDKLEIGSDLFWATLVHEMTHFVQDKRLNDVVQEDACAIGQLEAEAYNVEIIYGMLALILSGWRCWNIARLSGGTDGRLGYRIDGGTAFRSRRARGNVGVWANPDVPYRIGRWGFYGPCRCGRC